MRRVTVRTGDILKNVLKLYLEDQDLVNCKLNVHFLGEKGIDLGGVTKDFFTSFWEAAFQTYFDGDVVKSTASFPSKVGRQASHTSTWTCTRTWMETSWGTTSAPSVKLM